MPTVRVSVGDQQDSRCHQIGFNGKAVGGFGKQPDHASGCHAGWRWQGCSFQEYLPRRIEFGIENGVEFLVPRRDHPCARHEHQPRSGRHEKTAHGDRRLAAGQHRVGRAGAPRAEQRGENCRGLVKLDRLGGTVGIETLRGGDPLGVAS